jgi:hypothetical protein
MQAAGGTGTEHIFVKISILTKKYINMHAYMCISVGGK